MFVSDRVKKFRATSRRGRNDTAIFNVATSNGFAALDNDKTKKNRQKNENKPKLPAPIVVTDTNIDISDLATKSNVNFRVKRISIGTKIFVDSNEEREKMLTTLAEMKSNFYSHPNSDEKTFKAVLSGLPVIDVKTISASMSEEHKLTTQKIVILSDKLGNGLYLVYFAKKDVNMALLRNIKYVHKHVVKWMPYKPKRSGPTQCYRCGMFGHGAAFCNRTAICLKCGGQHAIKDCTVVLNPTDTHKCINCAAKNLPHDHRSTDESCAVRTEYIQMRARLNKKSKNTQVRKERESERVAQLFRQPHSYQHFQQAPTPPPLKSSFAHVLQNKNNNNNNHGNGVYATGRNASFGTHSSNTNTNNDLWSIAEVSEILLNSLNELSVCKTKFDQLRVITNLLQNVIS